MGTVRMSRGTWMAVLVSALVIIDQIIKVVVKTNMSIGESINVFGDWFQICYVENEGMAFGMKFGGVAGKYFLTVFRLVIAGALIWWMSRLVKEDRTARLAGDGAVSHSAGDGTMSHSAEGGTVSGLSKGDAVSHSVKSRRVPAGVMVGLSMVLAGAIGNIIDCLFYGPIWNEAPFMLGKVVDMFYFPIIDTTFPEWLPVIGGHPFKFFTAIFNFADSCVTCGSLYLIFFQYSFFAGKK